MMARRAAPERMPIPRQIYPMATACLALLAGFLLLQTEPLVAVFKAVSELLSLCATAILRASGLSIVRTGTEIRDSVSGHAIIVTEACDGSSLVIAAIAVSLFLWQRGKRDLLLLATATVMVIFAFNLLRVVLLFLSVGTTGLLDLQHLYIAPLLSALLVAGVVMAGLGRRLADVVRSPLLWAAVAVAAAPVWYPVAELATCYGVVPLTNTLLWLAPGDLERAIVCGIGSDLVSTAAVVGHQPLRVLDVPFYPTDFTLAAPLVVASLALNRRLASIALGAVVSLGLMAVAMALGAMTAAQDAAATASVNTLMGQDFSMPFVPAGGTLLALMKAAQNAFVHFNLFVLPLYLLGTIAPASPVVPVAPRRPLRQGRAR